MHPYAEGQETGTRHEDALTISTADPYTTYAQAHRMIGPSPCNCSSCIDKLKRLLANPVLCDSLSVPTRTALLLNLQSMLVLPSVYPESYVVGGLVLGIYIRPDNFVKLAGEGPSTKYVAGIAMREQDYWNFMPFSEFGKHTKPFSIKLNEFLQGAALDREVFEAYKAVAQANSEVVRCMTDTSPVGVSTQSTQSTELVILGALATPTPTKH